MTSEEQILLQKLRKHLEQNRLKEALALCRDLNGRFPDSAEGWCAASVVACRLGNAEKGLEFVGRALIIDPDNAKFMVAKANALLQSQKFAEAASLAESVAAKSPEDARAQDMAGGILSRCNDYQNALQYYENAVALVPANATYQFNLATVKRFLGDQVGAESCLDRAIDLNSDDFEAYHLRSDLRSQTAENNHVSALQERLSIPIQDWRGEMKLRFSLAKELEDLAEYEQSFAQLKQGADLRRRHMTYRVDSDLETIDRIVNVYSDEAFNQIQSGCPEERPIFIVGLPRTGTTLIDRILSSHDQVHSAGELNNFALALTRLARNEVGVNGNVSLVEQSAKLDFSALGEAYLASIDGRASASRFVTDKLPLNFLYCGLIHKALPEAKIIHVTRNPLDACYAMYKRLFRDAYPMSYDLTDLGRYYLAYRRLMQHWNRLLPDVIYPVAYEDLVANQEATSRSLIERCDLPWQDSCLRFQDNPAASTTASASQIRQPVYDSSIGKWRHYERELQPLIRILEKSDIEVV